MENQFNKKVFINPNFNKGSFVNNLPLQHNSLQRQSCLNPNDSHKQGTLHNAKIYINPNFIAVKPVNDNHKVNIKKNENVSELLNIKRLFKSKYSIINNSEQKPLPNQISNLKQQVVQKNHTFNSAPLAKSRYCIVRQMKNINNEKDVSSSNYQNNISTCNFTHKLPVTKKITSNLPSYNDSVNLSNKNSSKKVPENVTKIKINRYKTVPINYLKNNRLSEEIIKKAEIKSPTRNFTKLQKYYKNRFKYVKINAAPIIKTQLHHTVSDQIVEHKLRSSIQFNQSKIRKLKTNLKINNIPCRLFSKYGKCLRKDYGHCEYLHDKKHVSLCRKFLKGICHDSDCSLSHELTDKKMPTCYFYLKGMCNKENCPYLHIKLSDETKICQDFMKGYCENGEKCLFRHVEIQQLKRKKKLNLKCSSVSYSPNRMITSKKSKVKNKTNKIISKTMNVKKQEINETDHRYYTDTVTNTNDTSCEIIKPIRCKLGALPSYIKF